MSGELTQEDQLLWSHVTRQASPMKERLTRSKPQGASSFDTDEEFARLFQKSVRHDSGSSNGNHRTFSANKHHVNSGESHHVHRPAANIDERSRRKIGRGRIEIDAKIDLHGMRQREAHSALRRFLFDSQARGCRVVLVITGKGSRARSGAGEEDQENYDADMRAGVLRRNVPYWIQETDLRSVVSAFTTAHIRHGGEGAIYVRLRKRRPVRPR